jgi:hypothetical protein
MSTFLSGKELPLHKSTLNHIGSWFTKQKTRNAGAQTSQIQINDQNDSLNSPSAMKVSPFAIRGALEALYYSFAQVKD